MSEQLRAAIHRYFREFGHEIADAVYQEVLKPGGMRRLLKRLEIYSPEDSGAQYEHLILFLRGPRGVDQFMQLVGLKPLDYQIGMQEKVTESSQFEEAADRRVELLKQRMSKESGVKKIPAKEPEAEPANPKSPTPSGIVEADPDMKVVPMKPAGAGEVTVGADGFPKGPLVPAPAPEPGTFGPDTPSYDPSKPHDPKGVWPEVERRSGRERRRIPERRKECEIVFKNRRYGRDRRSGKERRRDWPKDGHKE